MNKRKILTIAVPLALGLAIQLSLTWMNGPKAKPAAPESPANSAASPDNPAHEKASLEEQLKRTPGHAPILLRLAELERSEGHNKESLDYLKRAVTADPASEDALLELSKSLYESGDVAAAEKQSKQLIEKHPDSVDGLYNLGAIYANEGRVDLARQHWERAVSVKPDSESGRKAKDGLQQLGVSAAKRP
ncbi:MAG: tetratricopeptide repeat protein [Bryobacteraceae bacterium]